MNYKQQIEEILAYYESDGSNITGEKTLNDLLALIHSAQREERERIKEAFISHFSGSGEQWFPRDDSETNADEVALIKWEELLKDYNCPRQE